MFSNLDIDAATAILNAKESEIEKLNNRINDLEMEVNSLEDDCLALEARIEELREDGEQTLAEKHGSFNEWKKRQENHPFLILPEGFVDDAKDF